MAASGAAGDGPIGDEPIRDVGAPVDARGIRSGKRLNVILDIDETFVQYVNNADWAVVPEAEKAKYQTFVVPGGSRSGLYILRPGLREFFTNLIKICRTINLWTFSDSGYAKTTKKMLESLVPGLKIQYAWSDETQGEAEDEGYGNSKDLKYIWGELGLFAPCDTVLVDDMLSNVNNASNRENAIRIHPFDPLGAKYLGVPGQIRAIKMEGTRLMVGHERREGPKEKAVVDPATKTPVITWGDYIDLSKDDELGRVYAILEGINVSVPGGNIERPRARQMKAGGRKTRRKGRKTRARKTKTRR